METVTRKIVMGPPVMEPLAKGLHVTKPVVMELHAINAVTGKTVTATVKRPVVKAAAMVYAGRLAVSEPAVKQIVMVNATRQPVMPAAMELAAMELAVKSPALSPAVKEPVL